MALLRAINVGGKSIMRMADLRAQFEAFGLDEVTTYIQTGNVVFSTTDSDPERLARALERHLADMLGYRGTVFVLSREQLLEAAAHNPFDPARFEGDLRSHLMFLSHEPEEDRKRALLDLQGEEYRFAIRDRVLYYAYPRSFDGRRRAIDFEKVLSVTGTSRTWQVVNRLIDLAT